MPPAPQPPEVANLPPELANNPQYEVLRELGRGGMGVVYLAKNKLMDRLEVLKVVNKALLDRPGAGERFLREIRSAAKLNHANVVKAYSAVQSGKFLAFAMEYVEGEDLAKLVQTQGPLLVVHACYYIQQAALGLQHAFEKQMAHRDIKPQNLMLARAGKKHIVKVLDFGLAKVMRAKNENTGLTNSGAMLGTPDYIAPEQTLDAASADIRADIYSLGCTLSYLLTGAPPFKGRSLFEVLQAHQSKEAEPLNLLRPEVPQELAAVVRKMMAKDPAQRYQTPVEVARALAAFVKPGAKPGAKDEARRDEGEGMRDGEGQGLHPSSLFPHPSKRAAPPLAGDTLTASSTKPIGPRRGRTRRPPAGKRSLKPSLLIGGIAGGLLLIFLLGLWAGGAFRSKTPEGTLGVSGGTTEHDQLRGTTELEQLQGNWIASARVIDGKESPQKAITKMRMTVQGSKIVFESARGRTEMDLSIDSSTTPKTIDMDKGRCRGIYKLEGDSFTVCHTNYPDRPRPNEFSAPSGSGLVMIVWKRKP